MSSTLSSLQSARGDLALGARPSSSTGARRSARNPAPLRHVGARLGARGAGLIARPAGPRRDRASRGRALAAGTGGALVVAAAGDGVVEIAIDGMMCDGCTSGAQSALESVPGVKSVSVTLEPGMAKVELEDPAAAAAMLPKLLQAVAEAGFEARAA